jgi:hypothetical protein
MNALTFRKLYRSKAVALAAGVLVAAIASASVDVNNYSYLTGADGARATGMGGAGYALAEGYEGILTNPAGLAATPFPQVNADWSWYGGMKSGALNLAGWGFGFSGRFARLSRYFVDSYPPFTAFGGTGGELALGYGRRWRSRAAWGGSLKLLSFSYNDDYSAAVLAADVGAKYDLTPGLGLSGGLRNLGGRLKWEMSEDATGEPAPRSVPSFAVAGVGWNPFKGKLLLAADGYFPLHKNEFEGVSGKPFYLRGGLEYRPWSWVALRTGYRGGLNEIGQALTFGIVFRLSDFDVDAGGAPGSGDLTYVGYRGVEKKMPPGSGGLSISYNIGRSKAAGAAEATTRLNDEFEKQKDAVVGQMLAQAERFLADARYEDAQDTLNIILVWDPDNERATALYQTTEKRITERDVAIYVEKARGFLEAGKPADAAVEAKGALDRAPDNAEAAGILSAAQERLAAETARAEEETRIMLAEGQRYYEQGNDGQAIASWSAVLSRDPGNEVAYVSLGAARTRLAGKVSALSAKGAAAETAGKIPEALRRYREILSLDPANADAKTAVERLAAAATAKAAALADQAEAALARKDYDRAQELAYEALVNKPGLGRAETVVSKAAAAGRAPAVGSNAQPEDYNKYYMKGIAAYTANNYAAAIVYWERIPPGNALYTKAAQNIERARKILQKLNE